MPRYKNDKPFPAPKPATIVEELGRPNGRKDLLNGYGHAMMSSPENPEEASAYELGLLAKGKTLTCGYGMGYTYRAAITKSDDVHVAEIDATVAAMAPPGTPVTVGDVWDFLTPNTWDTILLDADHEIDDWIYTHNSRLYTEAGRKRIADSLRDGGKCWMWTRTANKLFSEKI